MSKNSNTTTPEKKSVAFHTVKGTVAGFIGGTLSFGSLAAGVNYISEAFGEEAMKNHVGDGVSQAFIIGTGTVVAGLKGYRNYKNTKAHNASVDQLTAAKDWSTRVEEGDLARGDSSKGHEL